MELSTTRFGTIEIDENEIYTFRDGLYGLRFLKKFVIVQTAENSPFRWLQSVEEPGFALLLTDPWEYVSDYEAILSDIDVKALGLTEETPRWVYVTVTIPPGQPQAMTANLLAPLIFNCDTRQARQIAMEDSNYHTKHALLTEMWRSADQTKLAG
ncbi:MAG: flagellar assembly protein FliW [Armatimonadetes bacterium]|nr:flagellar assembly protein FliW [Armatimonadota bacterium]